MLFAISGKRFFLENVPTKSTVEGFGNSTTAQSEWSVSELIVLWQCLLVARTENQFDNVNFDNILLGNENLQRFWLFHENLNLNFLETF